MNWEQVKEEYPNKWVILEALKAHSVNNQWVVEQISVVDVFIDVSNALARYNEIHRQAPGRDYFVVHTDKENLNIYERHWVGVRTA
jgi:hypothetical protein